MRSLDSAKSIITNVYTDITDVAFRAIRLTEDNIIQVYDELVEVYPYIEMMLPIVSRQSPTITSIPLRGEDITLYDKNDSEQHLTNNALNHMDNIVFSSSAICGDWICLFSDGSICALQHDIFKKAATPLNGSSTTVDGISINIKYFSDEIDKLKYIDGKSDWIDLRSAKRIEMKAGEFKLIPLGIAMQLPKGYEAHVVPRSSTFKNFGIIQTNSKGIIDETYCGDNDQWFFPAYAMRDTVINVNDRICQFRIMEHQPVISFNEVCILGNDDRGGHGSTGIN